MKAAIGTKAQKLAAKIHASGADYDHWVEALKSRVDAYHYNSKGCAASILNFSDGTSLWLCPEGTNAVDVHYWGEEEYDLLEWQDD